MAWNRWQMTISEALYSKARTDWGTPLKLFEELNDLYHFDYDMACDANNALAPMFAEDTLAVEWPGNCSLFCNPPYGSRAMAPFFERGWDAHLRGSVVVYLVPCRTDTACFHDWMLKGEIEFLRGRLRYRGSSSNAAPFPSCIVRYV